MSEARVDEWVPVARLLRPQGRRGELLADPLSDVPGLLAAGASLRLTRLDADAPSAADTTEYVEELWEPTGKNAGRVVLKLRGCESITAAEGLAGKQLMIAATALPPLEEGTFYVRDLLGCTLWDGDAENGKRLGEIVDVQFATSSDGRQRLEDAAPLLEVLPTGAEPDGTVLVPFVRAYLRNVDTVGRRVEMTLPAGLFAAGDAAAEEDASASHS